MRCVDTGAVRGRDDDPPPVLVFLHGNPTSSFLWRNVIPALSDRFRCVAVDLIGMGGSGKPDIAYTWADHRAYLGEALDALETDGADVRLVMHGAVAGEASRPHAYDGHATVVTEPRTGAITRGWWPVSMRRSTTWRTVLVTPLTWGTKDSLISATLIPPRS